MNPSSHPPAREIAPTRVLLVDEVMENLAPLSSELRRRGMHVALANGIAMACERAKSSRVDVVLAAVELSTPRSDGLSLGDALAVELGNPPPILFLAPVGETSPGPSLLARTDAGAVVARLVAASARSGGATTSSVPDSISPSSRNSLYCGALGNVSLADVVETLWVDRKTGLLALTTPTGMGDVRFVDGSIVDAVYSRFEGMKALVRMLGEPEGRYDFTSDTPAVLRRIQQRTPDILRQSKVQLDEIARLRGRLGDLSAKALLAAEGVDLEMRGAPSQRRGSSADASLQRAILTKLRAPATLDDLLDDFPEPDAVVLAALVEIDTAGRLTRLPHETYRVPLVATDQLHLMRALVSRASAAGYEGATRLVFAGTPNRLAVFAHAALCLVDALPAAEPSPPIPIPHSIATVRLGDDVDLDLVALPLIPVYAPLWPLALAGSAIVVRLDEAAGPALSEACTAAELPIVDASVLVGSLEDGNVSQVAGLVRAAIEATQRA